MNGKFRLLNKMNQYTYEVCIAGADYITCNMKTTVKTQAIEEYNRLRALVSHVKMMHHQVSPDEHVEMFRYRLATPGDKAGGLLRIVEDYYPDTETFEMHRTYVSKKKAEKK